MATMFTRALTLCLALSMSLAPAATRAQEPPGGSDPATPAGSDEERLQRAKDEQAKAREADEAAKKEGEASAEAEAEKERVEKLGVEPGETLPEDGDGFFVGAEAYFAEIGGADRGIARIGDIVTSAATAEDLDTDPPPPTGDGLPDAYTVSNERVLALAYSGQVAPVIEIGFRRKGGAFSLRYFGWSSSANLAASSSQSFASQDPALGGLVLGGIDNQGFENTAASYAANPDAYARPFGSPRESVNNQLHGADSVTATGELEVSRLDFLYARTAIAHRRVEFQYRVGLSILDAKRAEAATFTWRSFDRTRNQLNALSVEDVSASCETRAIGPLVGAAGRFGLSKSRSWSARLGLEVAGLKAERELRFRDVQQFSQDGLPAPAPEVFQDTSDGDAGDFVTIIDADAAVEYRFGERLRVGLGYRKAWWMSALAEERFPSAANTALLKSSALDLDVGGPYVRLGVYF